LELDFRWRISDLMSDEIVDKLPPIFELMRLLFSYRFHRCACRRLIVSRRDSESNQELGATICHNEFGHSLALWQ
jgi:hypothetical protein